MRKKMNAFTLIELLAVIIILAVVTFISFPIIIGIVDTTKEDTFKKSIEIILSATLTDYQMKSQEEYVYTITNGNISDLDIPVKNISQFNGKIIYDENGKEVYAIYDGKYCIKKLSNTNTPEISEYEENNCTLNQKSGIEISNIELLEITNNALEINQSQYDKNTTNMYISLPNLTSTISYQISITNTTNKNYILDEIILENRSNETISYKIINLETGDLIKNNATEKFVVEFYYNTFTLPNDVNSNFSFKYNFMEYTKTQEYVLLPGNEIASKIPENIKTVVFDYWDNEAYNDDGIKTYDSIFDWYEIDEDETNDGINIGWGKIVDGNLQEDSSFANRIKIFIKDTTAYVLSKGASYFNPDSSDMFKGKTKLTNILFNNYNTSKVENMSSMFYDCTSLTTLNLNGFNTSKVTDMSFMFYNCLKLKELNLYRFSTPKTFITTSMFSNCSSLVTVYVGTNFITKNILNSENMFYNCSKLIGGNGTIWNSSLIDASYAYIDTLNVPGYFTNIDEDILLTGQQLNYKIKNSFAAQNHKVTKIVFDYFENYSDVIDWNTYESFVDTKGEGSIRLFRINDVVYILSKNKMFANKDSNNMFYNMRSTEEILFENFDTSKVTSMRQMFYFYDTITADYDSALKRLDLSNWDISNVETLRAFLGYSISLKSIDLSGWNTSKVTNMGYMFQNCESLTEIINMNFDTSNVEDMESMFLRCASIEELDLSSFDTSNVTDMHWMFNMESPKLKRIYVSNKFVTSQVTVSTDLPLFKECTNLVGGNGTKYDPNYIGIEAAIVDEAVYNTNGNYVSGKKGYFTLK